jgi:hypothetical protein
MTACELLAAAREAGLAATVEGDRLVVRGPKSADALARQLLGRKAEVMALIAPPITSPPPAPSGSPGPVPTPTDLLRVLRAAGFTARADNGRLLVSPGARLTEGWCRAIREHRDGLLALLAEEAADVAAEEAGRPFRDVPFGGGPNEVPAAEYQKFWAALREWNAGVIGRAKEEEARQQARAAAKRARREKRERGSAGAGMALTGLGEPSPTA